MGSGEVIGRSSRHRHIVRGIDELKRPAVDLDAQPETGLSTPIRNSKLTGKS